jgi:hypothetical protein
VSEPLNEIGAALAKAQCEMANPAYDKTNPHFKNKFASLAAVRNAVVPVLAKHGISVTQDLTAEGAVVFCSTILTHSSGQQMRFGPLPMPAMKADAQGLGSAATYARRYALMGVAGVVGDEDDDANAATGKPAAGIGIHAPIGETERTTTAELYASNFVAAFANDDVKRARELHADLITDGEEAYRNAWALLDSKVRTWAKKAIATKDAA